MLEATLRKDSNLVYFEEENNISKVNNIKFIVIITHIDNKIIRIGDITCIIVTLDKKFKWNDVTLWSEIKSRFLELNR